MLECFRKLSWTREHRAMTAGNLNGSNTQPLACGTTRPSRGSRPVITTEDVGAGHVGTSLHRSDLGDEQPAFRGPQSHEGVVRDFRCAVMEQEAGRNRFLRPP